MNTAPELTDEAAEAKFMSGLEDPALSDEEAIAESAPAEDGEELASDNEVPEDVLVGDHLLPGEVVAVMEAASEGLENEENEYVPHTGMDIPNVPVDDEEDESAVVAEVIAEMEEDT